MLNYGELNGAVLHVFLRPDMVSENRTIFIETTLDVNEIYQNNNRFTPVIFTEMTPIYFSDEELNTMIKIEHVDKQCS